MQIHEPVKEFLIYGELERRKKTQLKVQNNRKQKRTKGSSQTNNTIENQSNSNAHPRNTETRLSGPETTRFGNGRLQISDSAEMGRHITAQRQLGRRRSSELFQRTLRTRKPRFGVLDIYMSLGGIAETFLYFEGTGRLSQPRTKYLQNPCQSLGTVKGSVAAELLQS